MRRSSFRFAAAAGWMIAALLSLPLRAQSDVHALASRVDAHYNHLSSLRATFMEHYSGMGLTHTESGTLLLRKPGRMRWSYNGGKLFVLDGKYALSYVPGEAQAQRLPAKQLDDLRSPLRFLLGHTQLEKELSGLRATPSSDGSVVLAGAPRYATGPGENRVQGILLRVDPATGMIRGLQIREIDGSTTSFDFSQMQENVPSSDSDFRFVAPAGVSVVEGIPPA